MEIKAERQNAPAIRPHRTPASTVCRKPCEFSYAIQPRTPTSATNEHPTGPLIRAPSSSARGGLELRFRFSGRPCRSVLFVVRYGEAVCTFRRRAFVSLRTYGLTWKECTRGADIRGLGGWRVRPVRKDIRGPAETLPA
jgi:hypothetical protein